jgi:hypothetical protein
MSNDLLESAERRWSKSLRLTKLDVARRQLQTAITLWFTDGDPVSIHTLAFAAYEIIHVISKKQTHLAKG